MNSIIAFIAVVAAFVSGFGCAGTLDAVWGFNEWRENSIVLVTFLWAMCGTAALGLVFVL